MLSSGSAIGSQFATQSQSSYSNSGLEVEYANDPASGGFFQTDYKNRHEDLKQMLDSNKDGLKLEAMKRIIGMVAKGRDAGDLFPAVVKNVVSKNIEVKKLVYAYLVRYAEEQQDLALLSISTFQRALKDPNQLIRASALRVLSSIRVAMIVPIVMLAIRDSASDMSPYVRKTAAHAIPKLFSLDAEQKDELVMVLEKLLSDRTTLVVGSAVMAFEEVCPERVDLIHKNYRKLCNLLVDVDEWGQVIIINMLTRYARTQFLDPNIDEIAEQQEAEKPFYEDSSSSGENSSDEDGEKKGKAGNSTGTTGSYSLDTDHRTLLRQTKPLLQSRNAAVVMAVAQLYHHIAPRNEVQLVTRALIRLLRSHKEVQSVVLTGIASMSLQRKSIFEPFLKSFFVRNSDQTHIKLLKLEILTNLATATSISMILREFQTYISSSDKEFVAATIQAIGRCAATIKEVTETCLSGLVKLLSNRDEYVVAESVVVIKKLLQTQSNEHKEIISQMAKLLDFITVAAARAAIIWLIGEYNHRVPTIAPDVLRKVAKTFPDEANIVKLQALNLAVKLYLTNSEQTELLCQYVFNLAKYDQNYDIRDRARFLRHFVFPENGKESILSRNAKKIFLATKPAPALESKHCGREQYQLGSLSHLLNMRVNGYHDLPAFPEVAPDPSVRNIEMPIQEQNSRRAEPLLVQDEKLPKSSKGSKSGSSGGGGSKDKDKKFYSEEEFTEDSDPSSTSSSGSGSSSSSGEESGGEEKTTKKEKKKKIAVNSKNKNSSKANGGSSPASSSSSGSDSSSSSSSSSGSEDESSGPASSSSSSSSSESEKGKSGKKSQSKDAVKTKEEKKTNLDLLLDLDAPPEATLITPSLGGFLSPVSATPAVPGNQIDLVSAKFVSSEQIELLNKASCYGLEATYRFTRAPNLFSPKMTTIEIVLTNHNANTEVENVKIGQKVLPSGMQMREFSAIAVIPAKGSVTTQMGIDFNDSCQAVTFEIASSLGNGKVSLKPPVGELMRAVTLSEQLFKTERNKLRGMTEHSAKLEEKPIDQVKEKIFEVANVSPVPSSESSVHHFAGETISSKSLVLITVVALDGLQITVNCDKMVVGSILLNDIKSALS